MAEGDAFSQSQKKPEHRTGSDKSSCSPNGWQSRGYLPHLDAPGVIQHVTFHLADSLPRAAIARMQFALNEMPPSQRPLQRRRRVAYLLKQGMGSCILAEADNASAVQAELLAGDGERYRLLAWCVMPNHVHALIEQFPLCSLANIVKRWKGATSRRIRQQMAASAQGNGSLWMRDYWDRFVRNRDHLAKVTFYIEHNPVKAGLVLKATDWKWSSAGFDAAE